MFSISNLLELDLCVKEVSHDEKKLGTFQN